MIIFKLNGSGNLAGHGQDFTKEFRCHVLSSYQCQNDVEDVVRKFRSKYGEGEVQL